MPSEHPPATTQLELLLVTIAALSAGSSFAFFSSFALDSISFFQSRRWARVASPALVLVGLTLAWWACSSTFVLFNRFVLGGKDSRFSFPILLTWTHMAVKGLVALFVVGVVAQRRTDVFPAGTILTCSRRLALIKASFAKQQPTARAWWRILVPLAAATALDVCLSNLALQYAGVAVYTLTKSSTIIFTLVLTWLMRLQRITWKSVASVLAIGVGILLANAPSNLHAHNSADSRMLAGAAFAVGAAACGALRWVLSERWFGRPGVENDAFALIALLSPISVVTLIPGVAWELPSIVAAAPIRSASDIGLVLAATLGGGVLATLMVAVELQFVSLSSAMSITIVGTLKDLLQIALAAAMFGERLSVINAFGGVLALGGSTAYGILRAQRGVSSRDAPAATGKKPNRGLEDGHEAQSAEHSGDVGSDDVDAIDRADISDSELASLVGQQPSVSQFSVGVDRYKWAVESPVLQSSES
jgi:solute carrier family 35, member C2